MKTLLALGCLALTLAAPCAFAQGTIIFDNNQPRIYVGDERVAAVFGLSSWGPTVYVPANDILKIGLYFSLTENGTYTMTAETGFNSLGGRFAGGPIQIPGVPGGTAAWFQVRVWEKTYGADYESAVAAGFAGGRTAIRGVSNTQQLTLGTITPTMLSTGLQSFGVFSPIPEPSTSALGLLGLAGWLIARRRVGR